MLGRRWRRHRMRSAGLAQGFNAPSGDWAPAGAHGQRNIDGSFFSVWKCQNGHKAVSGINEEPPYDCYGGCSWAPDADLTEWTRCTPEEAEAEAFIVELEGRERAYDDVGFVLLTRTRSW
jgi:hypothetical protein